MSVRAGVLVAAALAAGCSNGPKDFDSFRSQLDALWCTRQVHCGVIAKSEAKSCGIPDVPLGIVGSSRFDIAAAVRRGSMQFLSEDAQRCLDAVRDATCDDAQALLSFNRWCHGVVTAQLPAGKPCLHDAECQGGACIGGSPGCGGTCVAWVPTNAACDPATIGTGVDPTKQCDPTVHYCDETTSTCKQRQQPGGSCRTDAECAFYFFCISGKCSEPVLFPAGHGCTGDPECESGLYCDVHGQCQKRVAKGQACDANYECDEGLGCNGGTCVPWLDLGAACTHAVDASGNVATGCPIVDACTNGSCQPSLIPTPPTLGPEQACTQSPQSCAPGLVCQFNECSYRSGLGGPCATSDTCGDGLTCTKGSCVTAMCPAAP